MVLKTSQEFILLILLLQTNMSFNITFHVKRYWVHFSCFGSPKLYLRSAIVSTVDTMKTRHDEKQSWMKRRLDV